MQCGTNDRRGARALSDRTDTEGEGRLGDTAAINADKTTATCPVSPIGPQVRREMCLPTDHDVNEVLEREFRGGNFRLVDWRLEPLGETKVFLGGYHHLRVMAWLDDQMENLRSFVKIPPSASDLMLEYLCKSIQQRDRCLHGPDTAGGPGRAARIHARVLPL